MIVQFVLSKHDKDVFWSYNSVFQVYYTIMCLGFIDLNSKIRQIISIIIQVALLVWNSGLYQLYTEIYYMHAELCQLQRDKDIFSVVII